LGEKVLKDAVFYSSKAAMEYSSEYEKFAAAYEAKYAEQPDRLVALGYDAIHMLAGAVIEGRDDPGDISRYLRSLEKYDGASGRTTFGRGRTNLELPLFTLKEGQVRPLVEIPKVEEPEDAGTPPDSVGTEYIKYEW
jgi:ABC-type branched-subunit amino acid transport system substrate-binding protein